jgi:Holliday junction resolvasome RuvABC endonuclease subunit
LSALALDLGRLTGWACGEPDAVPRFGTHVLPTTGDDIGRYLHAHREWLTGFIQVERPTFVVYEAPILAEETTKATVIKLMSLAGVTELICRDLQVRCYDTHLSSVKKFLTGTGRAKKADMEAAARRFGFAVRNDNEADAIAIWGQAVMLRYPGKCQIFSMGQLGGKTLRAEAAPPSKLGDDVEDIPI